jgi:hypothetical protein
MGLVSIIKSEAPQVKQLADISETAFINGHSSYCDKGKGGGECQKERMVNDPAMDPPVFPNITQSETSIARFGRYIVFGFNDSNNAAQNNLSGLAFSNDNGETWQDLGVLPKGTFKELNGDPVIASDSKGVFYYASLGNTSWRRRYFSFYWNC